MNGSSEKLDCFRAALKDLASRHDIALNAERILNSDAIGAFLDEENEKTFVFITGRELMVNHLSGIQAIAKARFDRAMDALAAT